MYIYNLGHMTKMAATPIFSKKNPSKIFSGTGGPISKKLGMIILKKENSPRASSAPALGLNTVIFNYLLVYAADLR